MNKKGRVAIKLSEMSRSRLQEVVRELRGRGAKTFDPAGIIDALIHSDFGSEVINKFVSDHTPEEYKLRKILEIPEEREKLMGLIGTREFGLSGSSFSQQSK